MDSNPCTLGRQSDALAIRPNGKKASGGQIRSRIEHCGFYDENAGSTAGTRHTTHFLYDMPSLYNYILFDIC